MTEPSNADTSPPPAESVTDVRSAASAFAKMGVFEDIKPKPERAPQPAQDQEQPEPQEQTAPEGGGEGAEALPPPESQDGLTEEDTPEQADEEPLYTVKIDGKEERVPLKELLAGYQKDKDYRLKTAKIAEERKAIEAERERVAALNAERQHYAQMLGNVIPALQQGIEQRFGNVDWQKLADEDPAHYVKTRAAYDAEMQKLSLAQAEQTAAQRRHAEEVHRSLQTKVASEREKLVKAIPAFADKEKAPKLAKAVSEHLKAAYGFSDDELSGIVDHRILVVAYDAMRQRQADKSRMEAVRAAKTVPQVQRPGASPRTDTKSEALKTARAQLSKTGKVEDAARVFKSLNIFGT